MIYMEQMREDVTHSSAKSFLQAAEHRHHLTLGIDVYRVGRIMSDPVDFVAGQVIEGAHGRMISGDK